MAQKLLDFDLKDSTVANPDGTLSTSFTGTQVVSGPGNLSYGSYSQALDFGSQGKGVVNMQGLNPNLKQFCLRFAFKVTQAVLKRQTIAESTGLPFSIFINKAVGSGAFDLHFSLSLLKHGWSGPDTCFKQNLQLNKWYSVACVYDFDTAALFLDEKIITVHAFPNGTLKPGTGHQLFIGTWVDGQRDHFNGQLAAFQWFNGIPDNYESLLDEKRSFPEWFITYKYEDFKGSYNPGQRLGKITQVPATGAHVQKYTHCAISYHDSLGAAFEMHGAIYIKYQSLTNSSNLGFLATDESKTTKSGGRKSIFSKGAIYWSGATGAVPVMGQLFLDYENMGESKTIGFPIAPEKNIAGGKEQHFQGARMYYKNGTTNAHEVHGDILTKFLALGGINKWGYPITNESDIKKGNSTIGKFSEFENCTIYWRSGIGAFEVHGHIRMKYKDLGGPLSDIGFPTSDEKDIPNIAGPGKANTFEKGSILWYGSFESIIVARPFTLFLGRINSKESEGFGMGQNDMYLRVKIKEGGADLFNKRYPGSGDYGGHNVKTLNVNFPVTITPNNLNRVITFYVDIWDADPGNDDHLGKYTYDLKASNGWGFRDNWGAHDVSFSKINSMTWSVKNVVDLNTLTETQKWWGVSNRGTYPITWPQCAAAFRDIDSEVEWWDVTDWLQKAFYEMAVKGVAKGGNCFGMSVEGIYARKNLSLFGMPINEITNWNSLKNEFNIKQCYQVGAGPIWWFLGQFLSGNTHDPKDVFNATRNEFNRGNHPVICIAQNYDFSGGPHCILPVAWDSSSKPWKITICDPNFPNQLKELSVDPDNNTFRYVGSRTYTGGAWSGGRFHYMPFTLFNSPPRTPVWEAILLILCGTVLILGDDTENVSITDGNDQDLNAHGSRAKQLQQDGHRPNEFFVNYNGFNPDPNRKPGHILIRKEDLFAQPVAPGTGGFTSLSIDELLSDRRTGTLATLIRSNRTVNNALKGRSLHYALKDPVLMASLPQNVINGLSQLGTINASRNFKHSFKATAAGTQDYVMKHRLTEIKLSIPLNANEVHKLEMMDQGTSKMAFKLHSSRAKQIRVQITNKLGLNGDYIHYDFANVPLASSKPLTVNMKPGFGGIELENPAGPIALQMKLSSLINKVKQEKSFTIQLDKGARVKPADFLATKQITVSGIDTIFGPNLGTIQI